ncbi:spore-associated protein A [Kitasatospora sp. NPDC088346]|uniref:spore-associated protein A n=1 Tax=Kitasatospora sp. NPDC088346 TaxID=3364073 RepID=UPI003816F961
MRQLVHRATTAVAVATAALAGVVLVPGSAEAAVYNGACGSGYTVVDSLEVGDYGTVYLTYSRSTGKNCVVNVRDNPGAPLYMNALVRVAGSQDWIGDYGQFTTYAGPVYVSAAGTCIDWGGEIETVYVYRQNVHCG